MSYNFIKMNTGRDTLNTNFEVIATKFSLMILIFFKTYPKTTIRKTGATMFVVNIMFSSNTIIPFIYRQFPHTYKYGSSVPLPENNF
jgi:hypothetical protein